MFEKLGCKSYQHIFWYLSYLILVFFLMTPHIKKLTIKKGHLEIAPNIPSTMNRPGIFAATCAQEWYDVKGAMRAVTFSDTNPSPFKDGSRSPLRDLLMGECTRYIRIDPAHTFAIDGIGKDFLASTIVMLVRMGYFGRGAIPFLLQKLMLAWWFSAIPTKRIQALLTSAMVP